jgi:phospholipase/carboxylesterase
VTSEAGPLNRPYVFLPAAGEASGPPLLLLHGTGGDEHDLLPLRDQLSPGAAVVSPRGLVLENGMPRFFRRLSEGVFDEEDLVFRADELGAFVRAATEQHSLTARSLVAVGFSNGANIASAMLLRHPQLLGGALLMAAMVPYTSPPDVDLKGLSVIVSNGIRDPMISHEETTRLERQLRERGAEVIDLPHPGGHQIDRNTLKRAAVILRTLGVRAR